MNFKNLQAMLNETCPGHSIDAVLDITGGESGGVIVDCMVRGPASRTAKRESLALSQLDECGGVWVLGFVEAAGRPDPRNPWN